MTTSPENFDDFDHRELNHCVHAGAVWKRMREAAALPHCNRYGGFSIATRYEDVRTVAIQHRIFSSASGISFPELDFSTPLIPAEVDPPLHSEYRGLLTRFLTRERVDALEPAVSAMVTSLLDQIGDRTHIDFVESFARPLPVMVSLELLGLPRSDEKLLDGLVRTLHRERGSAAGAEAAGKLHAYLGDIIADYEQRATDPDADILSAITLGTVQGRRLTTDEKLSIVRLLMFGGFDTTAIALASMVWWLAQHPEDRLRLAADPALADTAVEEFVRFSSPASYLKRAVTEPTTLQGCTLHAGDKVLFSFAAANRDPTVFTEPDTIVLDRAPNPHLGFGAGVHRCIGSFVAKLELRTALAEILRRFDSIELDSAQTIGWESGENQGICRLPIIVSRRRS